MQGEGPAGPGWGRQADSSPAAATTQRWQGTGGRGRRQLEKVILFNHKRFNPGTGSGSIFRIRIQNKGKFKYGSGYGSGPGTGSVNKYWQATVCTVGEQISV